MVKKVFWLCVMIVLPFILNGQCELSAITNKLQPQIERSAFVIQHVETEFHIKNIDAGTPIVVNSGYSTDTTVVSADGKLNIVLDKSGDYEFVVGDTIISMYIRVMPLWYSIIPPLLAIVLAMIFKEVLTALLFGLFSGTVAIAWFSGNGNIGAALFTGLFDLVDYWIVHTIADVDHASVILFSLLIGAVVQIIRKNGGMHSLVERMTRKITTKRKGLLLTWFLGILIFFDDYANTLVVGNTMRPVTDRLKVSREKLAFIVDSTAAPVASVAFVTTWIGVELSYIQEGLSQLNTDISSYHLFLQSLPYRFYPFLALIFVLLLIYMRRDFGPMLRAEQKALLGKNATNDNRMHEDVQKSHWLNAVIPVMIIVFGTFAGLFYTGFSEDVWQSSLPFLRKLSLTIGASDAFKALLWSSMSAVLVAFFMSVFQRLLTLREASDAIIDGFRTMLSAIVILILAWSLASITKELHTASFLAGMLSSLKSVPGLLPALTFVLAALVAFSTGSSWGTMAILYPLMMPVTWKIGELSGMSVVDINTLMAQMIAGILAGAVLGDHCSPISDTTILSSLASDCDHIEHVRTQMPYALLVGGAALVFGLIPIIWNVLLWVSYVTAILFMLFFIKLVGKRLTS